MALATVDCEVAIRTYLLGRAPVTAAIGQRAYGGVDLPAGYAPAPDLVRPEVTGPAVVITHREGLRDGGSGVVVTRQVYVRSYAATELEAKALDALVAQHLDGAQTAELRQVVQLIPGQTSYDPRGCPFVLSIYQVVTT